MRVMPRLLRRIVPAQVVVPAQDSRDDPAPWVWIWWCLMPRSAARGCSVGRLSVLYGQQEWEGQQDPDGGTEVLIQKEDGG